MTNNHTFILSGRYQIIRSLGTGQTSTVYLARHLSLDAERAIKVIPKTGASPVSVLTEAQLLKSLNHPGIPMIFDIEEDDSNYYLVEEYIQGESLEAYLLHHKFISSDLFLSFCEQLCDIFRYLHSLHPAPILYQDLKPEHIIVCGTQLKLIDFGVTWNTGSSGNNFKRFGNAEFSAPEVRSGEIPSITSDIYSLGKIIQFLAGSQSFHNSRNIRHIIQKATSPEPDHRYETVDDLILALQTALQQKRQPHLFETIAIVGSCKGSGCTHLAISLVSTLNELGQCTFYHERNSSDHVRQLLRHQRNWKEKDGYYILKSWMGFPFYGPGIEIPKTGPALHIYDFGADYTKEALSDADLILLLCADAPWHWNDALRKADLLQLYQDRVRFVCNPGSQVSSRFYAKQFHAPVYSYFYDPDPFQVTREKRDFALRLLSEKGRAYPFSDLFHPFPHRNV